MFDGDTLHMGLGDAAVKQGDKIIGCVVNGIFVLEGGKCKEYHLWSTGLTSEDATCSLDGTTFKVKDSGYGELTVEGHGAVFGGNQLWDDLPAKVASYDEAKAKAKAAVAK
ncbi:MAG TPA: hypothetical protein VGF94_22685 [Kofleriaceae bacterium]